LRGYCSILDTLFDCFGHFDSTKKPFGVATSYHFGTGKGERLRDSRRLFLFREKDTPHLFAAGVSLRGSVGGDYWTCWMSTQMEWIKAASEWLSIAERRIFASESMVFLSLVCLVSPLPVGRGRMRDLERSAAHPL